MRVRLEWNRLKTGSSFVSQLLTRDTRTVAYLITHVLGREVSYKGFH